MFLNCLFGVLTFQTESRFQDISQYMTNDFFSTTLLYMCRKDSKAAEFNWFFWARKDDASVSI